MAPQDRIPPQATRILPPLPVEHSVLRRLGIRAKELPHGLARLKHNLLLLPFHTASKESNICPNSHLRGSTGHWVGELTDRLKDTIAESLITDFGLKHVDKKDAKMTIFKSFSYLDQIAVVCLASGLRACQAPDCLQYQRKLERVVPVCHSWPGLRDWVLCITSCSLRTIRDLNHGNEDESKYGLSVYLRLRASLDIFNGLLERLRSHLTAFILLATPPAAALGSDWYLMGLSEPEYIEETAHRSGSIGGPRPDQTIYSFERVSVSSRRCPRSTRKFLFLTCRRYANLALALR